MTNSPAISIEALCVLDAIESRGSYASAAEQLNKVPSALSYIVQKLEEQLAVTLFVRQGRKAVLTPAGRHLLIEGRKVLSAINRISEQTQTIANGWEPRINIAIDSIFNIQQILPLLKTFLAEHPNIELDISEEVLNGSWEALIEDRVDLLIGAPAPVPVQQGIRATKIAELENIFVIANDHPLAQLNHPLTKVDIAQHRTVIVHDSAKNEVTWSANIIENSQHLFVSSVAYKVDVIVAGLGCGFLPKNLIQTQLKQGVLLAPKMVEHSQTSDLFMAWKIVNHGKGLQRLREILNYHLYPLFDGGNS
ncbi:MAG: LysR family transcriptional regulator [Colwellia sp.]|nr:LysR family transcriptional regulator [Colwellia sp.]